MLTNNCCNIFAIIHVHNLFAPSRINPRQMQAKKGGILQ